MKKLFYAVVLAGFVLALGAVAGAGLVHFNTAPYQFAKSLPSRLESALAGGDIAPSLKFDSTFVVLEGRKVDIELPRPISGGGMTPFRDGVLVLAGDGTFLYASSVDDVEVLGIAAPPNGFEAYRADAEGRFSDLRHALHWFRYNDVLTLEKDDTLTIVASFTRYFPDDACYGTAVAKLDVPAGNLSGVTAGPDAWTTLYETQPCLPLKDVYRALEGHTAGGRMTQDGAGNIYLGSGDYHMDGVYARVSVSQDDAYDHGKLVKIAVDGSGHEVIAKGLRNMQGVTWYDGGVWAVEHGMRGGDELNRIEEGGNYGWPAVTLGTKYNRQLMPGTSETVGRHDGFDKPVFSWLPSVAISSLNVIEDVHPAWDGDLLMASLRGNALFRIRVEDDRVLFAEQIPVGTRVRYAQPIKGAVVLWSDDQALHFLEASDIFGGDPLEQAVAGLGMAQGERDALQQTMAACIECHAVTAGDNLNAPSLAFLYGRPVASSGYDGYSNALQQVGGAWTEDRLIAYLDDPQGFAPGTLMPDPGIDDSETLKQIAAVIEALSTQE